MKSRSYKPALTISAGFDLVGYRTVNSFHNRFTEEYKSLIYLKFIQLFIHPLLKFILYRLPLEEDIHILLKNFDLGEEI